MVDEMRFPVTYETPEIKKWRQQNLLAQNFLKNHGLVFDRHYAASTACSPSRASLFTGHYPSLHGVTQTSGAAKSGFDPDIFWLDENTVPTLGDYLEEGDYETFYKGKWHLSEEDIIIPGTKNAFTSYDQFGKPEEKKIRIYENADRLEKFGFEGWVGPEPHGGDPRNSGSSNALGFSGRDRFYKQDTINLIKKLDKEGHKKPWIMVSSFVNPHDIALYGDNTQSLPIYNFKIDPSVPFIPPAPTANESLQTKPSAQSSYREVYQQAFQPTSNTEDFRRFYYSLHLEVDTEIQDVLSTLKDTSFYKDTIIIFTSDHGDLLGSHGGLFGKWHNMYEESIRVPLIIHNPRLFDREYHTDLLTSHVDLVPTILNLTQIDLSKVQKKLKKSHTEVINLVGKDLTPLILQPKTPQYSLIEPLFFMTDDEPTEGSNQNTGTGQPYESVKEPNHIRAVISYIDLNGKKHLFKFAEYFDNPRFAQDTNNLAPPEYEMYDLTTDPLETQNLVNPKFSTPQTQSIKKQLEILLQQQIESKRLFPKFNGLPLPQNVKIDRINKISVVM